MTAKIYHRILFCSVIFRTKQKKRRMIQSRLATPYACGEKNKGWDEKIRKAVGSGRPYGTLFRQRLEASAACFDVHSSVAKQ
jgi:hypothetical protein